MTFGLLAGLLGAILEEIQILIIMQVERNRAIGAIHLERFQGFMAAGIARAFERAHAAIGKTREQHAGIVDRHGRRLTCFLVHAFLDECLGGRDHRD